MFTLGSECHIPISTAAAALGSARRDHAAPPKIWINSNSIFIDGLGFCFALAFAEGLAAALAVALAAAVFGAAFVFAAAFTAGVFAVVFVELSIGRSLVGVVGVFVVVVSVGVVVLVVVVLPWMMCMSVFHSSDDIQACPARTR